MPKLNIIQKECHVRKTENIKNPIKEASFKYQYHPSMTNTKDIIKSNYISSISLHSVSIDKVNLLTLKRFVSLAIYL